MKVGLIGLGQMGRGLALRLLDQGLVPQVWNRSPQAAATLAAKGAAVADSPDALLDADIVISMLADDAAHEAVWIRTGLVHRLPPGTVHLNMASASLAMARQLAALHREAGKSYVAAPVFGRPEAAAAGQLDIVAAGDAAAIRRCTPLFNVLGRQWFNAGTDAPAANRIKIARNFLLGTIIGSLGEAFALVRKTGGDPAQFLDIITATSMSAPAYRNYGNAILKPSDTPTFALRLGLKDIEQALDAGASAGVPMPLAALLRSQHLAAIAAGYGEHDWSVLGHVAGTLPGISLAASPPAKP